MISSVQRQAVMAESRQATEVFSPAAGGLPGARRDLQSVAADWTSLDALIEGVGLREVKNVIKRGSHGILTEVFRRDWALDAGVVDQVFQVTLEGGAISGWHAHHSTTDRLFVNQGLIKIVLYDARRGSPTHGLVNQLCHGLERPALVLVPPGVWHAVQNMGSTRSALLNLVDIAYDYEAPDHWRLPLDTPEIPYRFGAPLA